MQGFRVRGARVGSEMGLAVIYSRAPCKMNDVDESTRAARTRELANGGKTLANADFFGSGCL